MKLIRFLFKVLLPVILGIALLFIACVSGLLILTLQKPEVVLNETSFKLLTSFAASQGWVIRWSGFNLDHQSNSWLKKSLHLSLKDPCVSSQELEVSGCGEFLDVQVSLNLADLRIEGQKLDFLKLKDFRWKFIDFENNTRGILNIQVPPGKVGESAPLAKVQGSVFLPDQMTIDIRSTFDLDPSLLVINDTVKRAYGLDVNFKQHKFSSQLSLKGMIDRSSLTSDVSGQLKGIHPNVPLVTLDRCTINYSKVEPGQEQFSDAGNLAYQCKFNTSPILPESVKRKFKRLVFSNFLDGNAQISTFIPTPNSRINGNTTFSTHVSNNESLDLTLDLASDIDARIKDSFDRWIHSTRFSAHVKNTSFEKLVTSLESTDWAVPAPFSTLKGTITSTIDGTLDLKNTSRIPFSIVTDLKSSVQKFLTKGEGVFSFSNAEEKTAHLELDLNVEDAKIYLPTLDYSKPPTLALEDRISTETPTHDNTFSYRIGIKTANAQSLKLVSNLAKTPVPVNLNVTISSMEPLKGNVQIQEFPIKFFKRPGTLKHLNISLQYPIDESVLDGLVQVSYIDYDITVKILSTLKTPVLKLDSKPYLTESQIYSTLLFGQPLNQLDSEQAGSLAAAQNAISSGITLFSLYVFASTPIQSVMYDPATGVVSTKIGVGRGTSLNLGMNPLDSRKSIGIQKRIGPHWSIKTEYRQSPSGVDLPTGYLEWSNRY